MPPSRPLPGKDMIRRITAGLGAFLLALLVLPAAGAADKPLEFGVFPNLSARTVVALYQPLRVYLENRLGRPVNIYTAPDFKVFVQRSLKREYDFMVAAPHFARLAQQEAGYRPLAVYSRELRAILVVAKDGPVKSVADLKGQAVALPDPIALMSMFAVQLLRDGGLKPEKDVSLTNARSHDNAVSSVIHGESAAAATSAAPLAQMPDELKNKVRILATSDKAPHQIFMASPKLSAAEAERLGKLLLDFAATPEGRRFIETSKFGGIRPITETELKQLDPYAAEVKRMLGIR